MRLIVGIIISASLLSSCSFNMLFLHPWELNSDDEIRMLSGSANDTISISFDSHQNPVFRGSDGDTVVFNYSIQSHYLIKPNNDSLNYWMIEPMKNYNGTTIFFLHGNAANLVYQFRGMTPFVEKGYRVIAIDYSGFGFSQGKAKRKFVIEDARQAMDYLLRDSTIKYDHLLIYGQSLGGHLAAAIADEYEDDIDGLITEGAFASHKEVAKDYAGIGRIFIKEGYSGQESITNFNKPVLIIHSTEDETVDYRQGELLFSAANEPKTMLTIDKCHICGPAYYCDTIEYHIQQLLN